MKTLCTRLYFFLLPFVLITSLYANPDRCCNNFRAGIDFLYWKPCVSQQDYAATYLNDSNQLTIFIDYQHLCHKWEPGVRLFLEQENILCNTDFTASYTFLNSTSHESLAFPEDGSERTVQCPWLKSTLSSFFYTSSDASWNAHYHNWDALLRTHFDSSYPCIHFSILWGLGGLSISQQTDIELNGTSGNSDVTTLLHWRGDYWGVGLKSGVAVDYALTSCLSLFGQATASLIAGVDYHIEDDQTIDNGLDGYSVREADTCQLVPGYHLQIGIEYKREVCAKDLSLRAGYEVLNWFYLPNPRYAGTEFLLPQYLGSYAGPNNIRSFGFHGLFVGLDVGF